MKTILVTDTLFILPEHEAQLKAAGYTVERLPKPDASEAELVNAIKGKVGYIMGGIEKVTEPVIEAADELKAIVFAGSDSSHYIPANELATKKGIAIADAPGANAYAVAEYTIGLLLMMLRHMLILGRTGDANFMTTSSLADSHVGILGMGHIGERVARMLVGLGASNISYWNRTRKPELETELGITYLDRPELIKTNDVISNHLSSEAGQLMDAAAIASVKDGAVLINAGAEETFDMEALYKALAAGRVRAAFDDKVADPRFKELPLDTWFCSNENAAFNTHAANKLASDMATASLLSLLATGQDKYRVN